MAQALDFWGSSTAMGVQRRISPDPSLGVRELASPLKDYMKEKHNWDLLALLKPKLAKTSWKTAPDVAWLSAIAGLYVRFAKLSPNLCLSGSKLRVCLQKLDDEMKLNTSTMTSQDWCDKLDTWLRIAAAQYRTLKKKYICSMKKASEQEKQNIDSVLALVEDCDDLPPQAPAASVTQKQEQCQAIVPYVAPKSAENSRSIFKKILEKKDSCPESPSPAKMLASKKESQKAQEASYHKEAVKQPLALKAFLAQQPKDPVLKEVQKTHAKKKNKNKKEPAKKGSSKGQGKKQVKKVSSPKKKPGKKAAKKVVSPAASQQQELPEAAGKKAAKVKAKGKVRTQWCVMFYKKGPSYAVRKKGGKQLFQISTLHKSPSKVRDTCSTAMEMLEKGQTPEKVKTWAKSQHI